MEKSVCILLALLKTCARRKDIGGGIRLHAHILKNGLLDKSAHLGSSLIHMYASCGDLGKASQVFHEIPSPDLICWNALISGYAQRGHGEQALKCFVQMQNEGFTPSAVTYNCMIKVCGSMGAADRGRELHAEVVRKGLLKDNILLGTALVDMYAKCGALAKAQQVFSELHIRDKVSWTALIIGYAQHGQGEEALNCYEKMRQEGLSPDETTFVCILTACGSIKATERGKQIHAELKKEGFLRKNTLLDTALIDMYAKCGELATARRLVDELSVRNSITWTTLVTRYAEHGYSAEALMCFEQMQLEGLCPNNVTFACSVKACSSIGAIQKGKVLHVTVREDALGKDTSICTALVDMYAKCGELAISRHLFDEILGPSLTCWNALITGHIGDGDIVLDLYKRMLAGGVEPDVITFTAVLTACSHAGLLDEGQMYYMTMTQTYDIVPTWKQHTCMVDLFCRSGCLENALAVIKEMPSSDDPRLWCALLSACQKCGNVRLGSLAFKFAVTIDKSYAPTYILMQNMFAAAGMEDDVIEIEAITLKNESWKDLEFWDIDIDAETLHAVY